MSKLKPWTKQEIQYLVENGGTSTMKQLMAGLPERGYPSIYSKLKKLGLHAVPGPRTGARSGPIVKLRVRETSPLWEVFNGST